MKNQTGYCCGDHEGRRKGTYVFTIQRGKNKGEESSKWGEPDRESKHPSTGRGVNSEYESSNGGTRSVGGREPKSPGYREITGKEEGAV